MKKLLIGDVRRVVSDFRDYYGEKLPQHGRSYLDAYLRKLSVVGDMSKGQRSEFLDETAGMMAAMGSSFDGTIRGVLYGILEREVREANA